MGGRVVTDTRILVEEKLIQPGQRYVVEGSGDLGANSQASLVCRYFNGRRVLSTVFWYEPNNLMGRDNCPFLSYENSGGPYFGERLTHAADPRRNGIVR